MVKRGETVPIERVLPELKTEEIRNPAIVKANPQLLKGLDPTRTVGEVCI